MKGLFLMVRKCILVVLFTFFSFVQTVLADQGFVQRVVKFETDDGMQVPAILTYPTSGIDPYTAAFIHYPDGMSAHPVDSDGVPRFFAEKAAEAGYTSISLLSRHAGYYHSRPLEEGRYDIKAAVDFLEEYGASDVILTGQGLGTVRTNMYMTEAIDARVKAVMHFSPIRDMPEWLESEIGGASYRALTTQANQMIADDQGSELVSFRFPSMSGITVNNSGASYSHTAENFLKWWGPEATSRNSEMYGKVKAPMFIASGDKDGTVNVEHLKSLKSGRVKTIIYTGRGHSFVQDREQVVEDALDWVAGIGYGVRPKVNIQLVDATTKDGRVLSGVKYEPASGGDTDKPVFLLLHGWTGDVLWSSNHWLGVRLAQNGYTAIAMRLRVSGRRGTTTQLLSTVTDDIGAWTEFADSLGYDGIVGEGHSAGGIWWTTYLVNSQDDRVKGVVYLAPTRDMASYLSDALGNGPEYDRLVSVANQAVADGQEKSVLISKDLLSEKYKSAYPFFQYADAFLSYWGPDAKSVHTEEVAKLSIPVLAIAGSADWLVPFKFLEQFTSAAGGPSEYRFYDDGAPHSFVGWEDRTTSDVLDWVEQEVID